MLDSAGIQGQSVSGSSTSSSARSHAMSTVMDTWLPFGRLVGVALPVDMTEDAMRVATAELMPEEIAYSLGLSPAIQVRNAFGADNHVVQSLNRAKIFGIIILFSFTKHETRNTLSIIDVSLNRSRV